MKKIPFDNKYQDNDDELLQKIKEFEIKNGYIRLNNRIVEKCSICLTLNNIYSIYCRGCSKKLPQNKNDFIFNTIDTENIRNEKMSGNIKLDILFKINILQSILLISKIGQIQIINVIENTSVFIDELNFLIDTNELICDVKTDMKYLYFLTTKHIKKIPLYVFNLYTNNSNFIDQIEEKQLDFSLKKEEKNKISKNIEILETFNNEISSKSKIFLIWSEEEEEINYIIKDEKDKLISTNIEYFKSEDGEKLLNSLDSSFLDNLTFNKIIKIYDNNILNKYKELVDIEFYKDNILVLEKDKLHINNIEITFRTPVNKIIKGLGVNNRVLILSASNKEIYILNLDLLDLENKNNPVQKISLDPILEKELNLPPILYNIQEKDVLLIETKDSLEIYKITNDKLILEKEKEKISSLDFMEIVAKKIFIINEKKFQV